ncbi:MAG: hypothetical protein LBH22_05785 [Bacteroidales bacterium]|jgi:hypothetical protein|nr:hypothetical protein [Bacteroidales bacterium]
MKYFIIIITFLGAGIFNIQAQGNLMYKYIQQAKNSNEQFHTVSVFSPADEITLSKKIQDNFTNPQGVYIMQYDPVLKNLGTSMTLYIPTGNTELQLELQQVSMHYQIRTSWWPNITGKPKHQTLSRHC